MNSLLGELIYHQLEKMYDQEESKEVAEKYLEELLKELDDIAITQRARAFVNVLRYGGYKQIDFLYPPTQEEIADKIADDKRMSERNGDL